MGGPARRLELGDWCGDGVGDGRRGGSGGGGISGGGGGLALALGGEPRRADAPPSDIAGSSASLDSW